MISLSRLVIFFSIFTFAAASQAEWPERPIRMVLPYAAGSGVDVAMRPVADALARELGQPVLVDNRGSAGGLIGTQAVFVAPPDGYTIGFGNLVTLAINRSFYSKLPYDPEKLTPIGYTVGNVYVIIAKKDLPASNFRQLIALAKTQPGKLMMGSPGHGSAGHLATALIEKETGASFTMVPYKTGSQGVGDMINGQLDVMIENIAAVGPFITDKRIKPIAVTGLTRSPSFPDVPTVHESGMPNFEVSAWGGLVAPPNTPAAIIDKLNKALNRALVDDRVVAAHKLFSIDTKQMTPAEFGSLTQSEANRWGEAVRRTGAKAD